MSIDYLLLSLRRFPLEHLERPAFHDLLPSELDIPKRLEFFLVQPTVTLPIDSLQFFSQLGYLVSDVVRWGKWQRLQIVRVR